jgi:hypothetical protein
LLTDLTREIRGAVAEQDIPTAAPLNPEATFELTTHISNLLRLMAFSQRIRLDGMLVFTADREANPFRMAPVFDIFNPRARRGLHGQWDYHDLFRGAAHDSDFRGSIREIAAEFRSDVAIIPEREAATGFMTLFADSLRAAMRAFRNSSYVNYTVTTRKDDYQLEYYPQYYTSPEVFGSKLTSPVSQDVLIGHYRFRGWYQGQLTRDPGLYWAGPNNLGAHLRNI